MDKRIEQGFINTMMKLGLKNLERFFKRLASEKTRREPCQSLLLSISSARMVNAQWVWGATVALALSLTIANGEDISSGTGFIISDDGYILTCNHIISNADAIGVVLPDGRKLIAEFVAGSEEKDLAVLKIEADKLPTVMLGDSDKAEVTDEVMALGYPLINELGTDLSVSSGTINSKREKDVTPLFQIDLTLNPGNSGGPVLNTRGEVIGIAASRLNPIALLARSGNVSERVNFAIPINEASWLVRKAFPLGRPQQTSQHIALTKKEALLKTKPAVVLIFAREKAKVTTQNIPVMKAQPVDKSQPTVDSESPEEHIRDYIQSFIASGESKEDNPIGIQMVYYTFPVSLYFDKKNVSKADVRKDIEEYREKWPTRHYTPSGRVYINPIPKVPGSYYVQYEVEFDVENSAKRVKGLASYQTIVAHRKGDWFEITAISEKFLRRFTIPK